MVTSLATTNLSQSIDEPTCPGCS